MYIAYLLKIINTKKLSELVAVIEATPLDMNLAIYEAIDNGEIEADFPSDKVKLLVDPKPWHDTDLTNKLLRTIQHYAKNEQIITRGRLNSLIKDPLTNVGYPNHEYIMSMQYLVDNNIITEEVIEVPKNGKRPYHKFVFHGLPENGENNQEWAAKAVNKWIAEFDLNTVK